VEKSIRLLLNNRVPLVHMSMSSKVVLDSSRSINLGTMSPISCAMAVQWALKNDLYERDGGHGPVWIINLPR
jgi:hypothetical protein